MLHEWSGELSERDYRALGLLYARAVWRPRTVTRIVCRGAKGGRGGRHPKQITLQPGQLLVSERTLAEDWGWSRQRVQRAIAALLSKGILKMDQRMGDAGTVYQLPSSRARASQKRSRNRRFRTVRRGAAGQPERGAGQPEREKAGQPETQSQSAFPGNNRGSSGPARTGKIGPPYKKTTVVKQPSFAVPSHHRARTREAGATLPDMRDLRAVLASKGIEWPELAPQLRPAGPNPERNAALFEAARELAERERIPLERAVERLRDAGDDAKTGDRT